ncbi:MAG: serine/threonine-protein kinase [Steroidobacteraceae bacterium]
MILARLSHPAIARFDCGTTPDGVPYLVMEFVEGQPIDAGCREHAPDWRARVRLLQRICEAVDYAHRNLVVHRDLKPSNVLVDANGDPKLLDFGVAKLIDDGSLPSAATVLEQRALTPRYASPEQVRGDPVSIATDVYSLGVLSYEVLTGQLPHPDARQRLAGVAPRDLRDRAHATQRGRAPQRGSAHGSAGRSAAGGTGVACRP